MEPLVPQPARGRTFRERRRVRLSDLTRDGRLRLDAVARYLQDVASDDVEETGWGPPEHLWVLRSIRIDVLTPSLDDGEVELVTWCSGTAPLAAGRRMSLAGDGGGRIELDSVWIHLGPDARPARIDGFGAYAEAAGARVISTRLGLPVPSGADADRRIVWPVRLADIDLLGHVNNAIHWQAVEQQLADGAPDPRRPLRALLDYRHAIDLGEDVELAVHARDARLEVAFVVGPVVKAVSAVQGIIDS